MKKHNIHELMTLKNKIMTELDNPTSKKKTKKELNYHRKKQKISPEKQKEYSDRYYQKHKKEIAIRHKKYRDEHKEEIRIWGKIHREKNKLRIKKRKQLKYQKDKYEKANKK